MFIDLLTKHRSSGVGRDSDFVASATQGAVQRGIHEAAYIDPSDPTSVFLAQPPGAPVFPSEDNVEMCELVREAPHSSGNGEAVSGTQDDVAPTAGGNMPDESGETKENAGQTAEADSSGESQAADAEQTSQQADDPEPIIIPSWIAQRQENPIGAGTAQIRRRRVPRYEDYTRSQQ